jgi:small subunit ribosomal protein S21
MDLNSGAELSCPKLVDFSYTVAKRRYPLTGLRPSGTYFPLMEAFIGKPVEVEVRDSLEKAMKILKQKMSKEGILQELKRRRFYEKPSVKRKRKMREARKRLRREMKRRPGTR